MKYENRTKHPLPPKILLSLVRDHAKYIKRLKELYKMNYYVTKIIK